MRSVSGTPRGFGSPARTQILTLAVMARGQIRHSMTLRTLLTIGLLTFCGSVWGQDSLNYHGQPFRIRDPRSIMETDQPLYIIKSDGKTCNVPANGRFSSSRQMKRVFKNFDTNSVQSIDVIKGQEATEKYGTLGKYGVIIINMKDGTFDGLSRKLKRGCG
jgi:hypothetical protein